MQLEAICPRCHREDETIHHALRDCPLSKRIWNQLGRRPNDSFFTQNLHDWLNTNATSRQIHAPGQLRWHLIFLFGIWFLWKGRNNLIFKNLDHNPNLAKVILDRALEYYFCANNSFATKRLVLRNISWEKPRNGWLTLNTDGSVASVSGIAGGGGLLRDANGDWVTGFARRIGITSSFMAELWGLRDGLQLCVQLHIQAVCIELDSKAIVEIFNSQNLANTGIFSLIEDCKHMISKIPQTWIRHIYREANRCADCLAKLGASCEDDFIVFSSPPVDFVFWRLMPRASL